MGELHFFLRYQLVFCADDLETKMFFFLTYCPWVILNGGLQRGPLRRGCRASEGTTQVPSKWLEWWGAENVMLKELQKGELERGGWRWYAWTHREIKWHCPICYSKAFLKQSNRKFIHFRSSFKLYIKQMTWERTGFVLGKEVQERYSLIWN